jgi:hypothetical protein
VSLIPMGCARLRISAFPVASAKPTANKWAATPYNDVTLGYASFSLADGPAAMSDVSLPTNSNDHMVSRFTWWPHTGTNEWVAYRYSHPQTFSWSDVYWYDDEVGHGGCRVPASWRLLYKEGSDWKAVKLNEGSSYGSKRDAFNKVTFEPVTAAEFRIEAQFQTNSSCGVLEWRFGPEAR